MCDSRDARLGELVDLYQTSRASDLTFRLENLRDEAGEHYEDLVRLVRGLGEIEACFAEVEPDPVAPRHPSPSRRWIAVPVGLVIVLAAGFGFWPSDSADSLELVAIPSAEVFQDGRRIGETPWPGERGQTITLRREGFVDLRVTLASSRVVHLEPTSGFDAATLDAIGRAYGTLARLPRVPPARVRGDGGVPDDALRVADPNAFERELARYPISVRDHAGIRTLVIANLIAGRLCAEGYAAAADLATDGPARHTALRMQLEALWGLDLVETELYRDLHAQWVASRP